MSIRRIDSYETIFKRGIKEILDFARLISERYQINDFSNDVRNIKTLYEKNLFVIYKETAYKNYSDDDIEALKKFIKRILTNEQFINLYFTISKKTRLHELWNLLDNLQNDISISGIILSSTSGIDKSEKMDKMTLVKEIRNSGTYRELIQKNRIALLDCTKDIGEIINNFERNRLTIKTLFSVMVSIRETHHHTLLTILNEAKKRSSMPYDIEEICSVENKVARGKNWVTDIIAIRNCIGHAYYQIFDNLSIHFRNYEGGYRIPNVLFIAFNTSAFIIIV